MAGRAAWLVLDGQALALDDHDVGYAMTELDIGGPDVRDVVNNRPNQHGVDDRTRFMGGRVVTAKITAWPGGAVPLDDIVRLFGPYANPAVRPELHWTALSGDDLERVLVLRASSLAAPMGNPGRRDFQLAWVAADPVIRDATVKVAIAWAGASTGPGRLYALTFNRVYPPGGGAPVAAWLDVAGDVLVRPLCQLFGPITGPGLLFTSVGIGRLTLAFKPDVVVDAGHYIEVDLDAHTARYDGDPTQDMLAEVAWGDPWPVVGPAGGWVDYYGSSTSGVTQCQVSWRDGYLT